MADFKKAYEIIQKAEGGYANDSIDNGGETYKGISRKNFPEWEGWEIVDGFKKRSQGLSLKELDQLLSFSKELQAQTSSFYKTTFWDALNLDNVQDQGIATEVFDIGVNMGTYIAAAFLQKTLNVLNRNQPDHADLPITGKVGSLTTAAVNLQKQPADVLKVLNCLQGARYVEICLANPTQEKFLHGWLKRVTL